MKSLLSVAALIGLVTAEFPPRHEGVKIIDSRFHPGVRISYKEPGICETTPGVKSYAGHIHLPPGYMTNSTGETQDYPMNTFFWLFEAREDPENAPLAIWLNGGPGGSSMAGLFQENGPCIVNSDGKTTRINPWSWNNKVNMLYIDQPNQVGFSYDTPTNFTVDYLTGEFLPADFSDGVPETNYTYIAATFASQNNSRTANTTEYAAHALWHFAQTLFSEFPHYKPNNDRVSIWSESYGGHFGPAFMKFFQQQNKKIVHGLIDQEHAHFIHIDTVGLISPMIDIAVQIESQLSYPFNNSYNLQLYPESFYQELMHNFTKPGGCKSQIAACQKLLAEQNTFTNKPTLGFCVDVGINCIEQIYNTYMDTTQRTIFDITHPTNDPFPAPYMMAYLAQSSVLKAIGSPVNFIPILALPPRLAFLNTADQLRGGDGKAIGDLLDSGVKVHLFHGDKDLVCNWVGGEALSLDIPYAGAQKFASAGYTELMSGGKYIGMTRQHGNFSFSRIFEAGHLIPSYLPQESNDFFNRAMFDKDIATGKIEVTDDFVTTGSETIWDIKKTPGKFPKSKCYVWAPFSSCSQEQLEKLGRGEGKIKDGFLVEDGDDDEDDWKNNEL